MKKLFFTMLLFSYILIYLIRTPGQSPAVSDKAAKVKIHVTEAPARFFDEGRPVDVTEYPAETVPTSAVILPEIPSPTPTEALTPTTASTSTPVPVPSISEGTAGALVIPSIGLSKPLTLASFSNSQAVCNSGKSFFVPCSESDYIGGHKHDGWTPLYNAKIGDEVYLYKDGVKHVYSVTAVRFFSDYSADQPKPTRTGRYLYIQTCQLRGYPYICVVIAEDPAAPTPTPSPIPTPTWTPEQHDLYRDSLYLHPDWTAKDYETFKAEYYEAFGEYPNM